MRPARENYEGREQGYVKHHFLAGYVGRLVMKVASSYKHVVYIDGFSGPWQSRNERFEDTSFGIALKALRDAKAQWKKTRGADVTMTALLVEKEAGAFRRLAEVAFRYPDINIQTFNGDFVELVPTLTAAIPPDAFSFVLMDPKGWKINMTQVEPLISRPNSELLLNFMFDFINRSASMPQPYVQAALELLLPGAGVQQRIADIVPWKAPAGVQREQALISCITEVVRRLGNYRFVMETPVLYPTRDRTFYSLIYATRSKIGVEVFRDAQNATLLEQDAMRIDLKDSKRAEETGMSDLFAGQATRREFATQWLAKQEMGARVALLDAVPIAPQSVLYGDVWPIVLAKWGVRRSRLGRIAAELKAGGQLSFLDWAPRKQVPDDSYRVQRPI